MLRLNPDQTGGREDGPEPLGRDDAHSAPRPVGSPGCRVDDLLDDVLEPGGSCRDIPTDHGQLPAVGAAVEQPHTQRQLQPVDASAHRGVIDTEQCGGGDKPARPCDGEQIAQVVGAHIERMRNRRGHDTTL